MGKTMGKGCEFVRGLARLNFPKKMQGGFTLIELLVVISIVSLLSSVVLAAIQSARKKADDTQRNQIVGEYVKALALVYDKTGSYPNTGNNTTQYCLGDYNSNTCRYGLVFSLLSEHGTVNTAVAEFLNSLPTLKLVTTSTTEAYQGPFYKCSPLVTDCSKAEIEWYLDQSNAKCIKGTASTPYGSGIKCLLTLN